MSQDRRMLRPLLGRERAADKEKNDIVQLCGFRVGDEEYAIGIERIKEIINPPRDKSREGTLGKELIRRVPKAPKFVEGVIELRGQVIPVIDMRKRFELPPLSPEEMTDHAIQRARKYLIVPIDERNQVGLIVDRVSDVLRVMRDTVGPPPSLTQNENARYFAGVCTLRRDDKTRILMVLALDSLLSSTEKSNLAELNQGAKGAST